MTTKNTTTNQKANIEELSIMHAIIKAKIVSIIDANKGYRPSILSPLAIQNKYKRLMHDICIINDNLHNATIGPVDVEAIRQRILRSL